MGSIAVLPCMAVFWAIDVWRAHGAAAILRRCAGRGRRQSAPAASQVQTPGPSPIAQTATPTEPPTPAAQLPAAPRLGPQQLEAQSLAGPHAPGAPQPLTTPMATALQGLPGLPAMHAVLRQQGPSEPARAAAAVHMSPRPADRSEHHPATAQGMPGEATGAHAHPLAPSASASIAHTQSGPLGTAHGAASVVPNGPHPFRGCLGLLSVSCFRLPYHLNARC